MSDALSFLLSDQDPKSAMRARMEGFIKTDAQAIGELEARLLNPEIHPSERVRLEALLAQYQAPASTPVLVPVEVPAPAALGIDSGVNTWRGIPLSEVQLRALRRVRRACGGAIE